jgi:redox-sensitive bicupin YhaK (pirin superfamily)
VTAVDSRVLLEPGDGSLGPLLRLADDRLPPGVGYGRHGHRDVDVVAVVLAGSLAHRWGEGAELRAGDVGILRSGAGLQHDEQAGAAGAHVVQTYLRAATPGAPPVHEVRSAPAGWVDLQRSDVRLWLARVGPEEQVQPPAGLRVVTRDGEVTVGTGNGPITGPATVWVWAVDTTRPAWAR